MKKNNKGFSLVELIVVIAIMAILAAVAIPTFAGFITKAQKSNDQSYMNDIAYGVDLALAKAGGIPDGHELRITITSKAFTYDVVNKSNDVVYQFDKTDVEAMLEDDYTAQGLTDETYHQVKGEWVVCDCEPEEDDEEIVEPAPQNSQP